MSQLNVAVLVGSLRKDSFNRKVAVGLSAVAPDGMTLTTIEIGDLPLYNPDLDTDVPPAAWTRFRSEVSKTNAVLFVTPEYNRSVPAALKNALDVGSRPYGQSVWSGKPAAIISGSPGNISGFGANHHLRQSLVFLDMPTLQQPEAYLAYVDRLVDESGKLVPDTAKFLGDFLMAFDRFAQKNL
ncbi:NAD(P)H-dependent oxidoreductase [Brucella pituitosa]|uniref:NADPH-dependent FMN reductase n=1 Tax=Brucella pituitosa TaxID=571256 RepID=UPI000C27973A|nr:NADPH-dependent FMN reductase [Brucella pituitosa]MCK4206217.1 NAD(P)H-dependent oxidoreductase [Brucella pituitosa]PJO46137.1 ACP phosphodiesterase [Brucella pituitosa]PRA85132.1 ACP phosphodiesterase [Ochrobactrum sp. MYb29]